MGKTRGGGFYVEYWVLRCINGRWKPSLVQFNPCGPKPTAAEAYRRAGYDASLSEDECATYRTTASNTAKHFRIAEGECAIRTLANIEKMFPPPLTMDELAELPIY